MTARVELRAAKIPFIGQIAVHYWLVILTPNYTDRWEVWQFRHCCESSWGHIHKNLMSYHNGVGNGGSWVEYTWSTSEANSIIKVIEKTPETYPYKYKYRYWPGPNSNTYVQWVLDSAEIPYTLGPLGLGKNYQQIRFF